jgi:hypothetical protein
MKNGKCGRLSCIAEGVFTLRQLREAYKKCGSVRATAEYLGVSPTTVKKYLKGGLLPRGRPIQPYLWKTAIASEVGQWFELHKEERLPSHPKDIAELSGFTVNQVRRFLYSRRKAAESYLKTLPEPTSKVIIFRDIEGNQVPSSFIKAFTTEVKLSSLDVTLNVVLTVGGQRVIKIPFREYEAALKGTSTSIPTIGIKTAR